MENYLPFSINVNDLQNSNRNDKNVPNHLHLQ